MPTWEHHKWEGMHPKAGLAKTMGRNESMGLVRHGAENLMIVYLRCKFVAQHTDVSISVDGKPVFKGRGWSHPLNRGENGISQVQATSGHATRKLLQAMQSGKIIEAQISAEGAETATVILPLDGAKEAIEKANHRTATSIAKTIWWHLTKHPRRVLRKIKFWWDVHTRKKDERGAVIVELPKFYVAVRKDNGKLQLVGRDEEGEKIYVGNVIDERVEKFMTKKEAMKFADGIEGASIHKSNDQLGPADECVYNSLQWRRSMRSLAISPWAAIAVITAFMVNLAEKGQLNWIWEIMQKVCQIFS